MITPQTSLRELAFLVCTHLKNRQITAVLTGGSAVTIYAQNQYQSSDLDFISAARHKDIEAAITVLGFVNKGKFYKHPNNDLTLDFPAGPLSIGGEMVKEWGTMTENEKTLYVLTPTQTVKDRLAHYFHWHDAQCLDQAVWVAKQQQVDFEELRAWSLGENNLKKFQDFLDELGA